MNVNSRSKRDQFYVKVNQIPIDDEKNNELIEHCRLVNTKVKCRVDQRSLTIIREVEPN